MPETERDTGEGLDTMREVRTEVWHRIVGERDRQDRKWGWLGTPGSIMPEGSSEERLAVLSEEFGEAAKAVNAIRHGENDDKTGLPVTRDDLHRELLETAAVCVAWVEADLTYDTSHTWETVPVGFRVCGRGDIIGKTEPNENGRMYVTYNRRSVDGGIPHDAPAWKPGCNEWTEGVSKDDPVPIYLNPKTGKLIYARGVRPPKLFR